MKTVTTIKIGLGTGVAILVLAAVPAAQAATLVTVPCSGPAGGSAGLIAAINTANNSGGAAIDLAAGCTYALTAPDNSSNGGNGLPVITSRVSLIGARTVIAGNGSGFRILEVDGPAGNLTLQGLTITGGDSVASASGTPVAAGAGGGILNDLGTLTLNLSRVTGNTADIGGGGIASGTLGAGQAGTATLNSSQVTGNTSPTGAGGGVLNQGGTLTVKLSQVTGNTAAIGGGIASVTGTAGATLTVTGSLVNDNAATIGGESPAGGGIANGGTGSVTASQVDGNTASGGDGGGVVNFGVLTVNGSQLNNNNAPDDGLYPGQGYGGGIANIGFGIAGSGVLTMSFSQVSNNKVSDSGGGIFNSGAGGVPASTTLDHVVVTGNLSSVGGGVGNEGALTVSNSLVAQNNATLVTTGNPLGPRGGGIYNKGTASIAATVVINNNPDNCFPIGSIPSCNN